MRSQKWMLAGFEKPGVVAVAKHCHVATVVFLIVTCCIVSLII